MAEAAALAVLAVTAITVVADFTTARRTAVIAMPGARKATVNGTDSPTVTTPRVMPRGSALDRVLADMVAGLALVGALIRANHAARSAASATRIAAATAIRGAAATARASLWGVATTVVTSGKR